MDIPANLPVRLSDELITGATAVSGVLQVADVKPQVSYLSEGFLTLTGELKAASLGPSQARKGSDVVVGMVEVPVRTLSVVYRYPEEWSSIDAEINGGLINKTIEQGKGAIAKAVDKIVLAGIDGFDVSVPGQVFAGQTTQEIELGTSHDAAINAAVRLLVEQGFPTSAILDSLFAYDTSRETNDSGVLVNPVNIRGLFEVAGLDAVASRNVRSAGASTRGFVFDRDTLKVSIGSNIKVSRETTGDPDNTGRDLKGHREHAIVMDVPYAAGILDLARWVELKDAAPELD